MTASLKHEVLADGIEIYCGDCREILPTLSGVDVILCDPPYGMSFQSNYRQTKYDRIANDDDADLLQYVCELAANHSKYIFCRWDNLREVPKPKSLITWVKNNWSMGDLEHEHARQMEVALFYPGEKHFFPKGRPKDVIEAPRTGNDNHPTEKPVQLMMAMAEWTSGVVCDPFMGSGTTGIACARLGRKFIGIEIEPKYFDIARKRIAAAIDAPDIFAGAA